MQKDGVHVGYKKYAKDYKVRLVSANDGREMKEEYVYTGDYFLSGLAPEKEKGFKRKCVFLLLGAAVCFFCAGLIDCDGMRVLYVALPYAVTLLPLGFMLTGAYRVCREKGPFKREAFDHGWKRLRSMSMLMLVLSGITVIGSALFMILNRDISGGEVPFLLLTAGSGVCAGGIYRMICKNCTFKKLEKDEKKSVSVQK